MSLDPIVRGGERVGTRTEDLVGRRVYPPLSLQSKGDEYHWVSIEGLIGFAGYDERVG